MAVVDGRLCGRIPIGRRFLQFPLWNPGKVGHSFIAGAQSSWISRVGMLRSYGVLIFMHGQPSYPCDAQRRPHDSRASREFFIGEFTFAAMI